MHPDNANRLYALWTRYKFVPLPWKVLPIVLMLAAIFSLDNRWLPGLHPQPEILHRLYYLPIVLSGLLFGYRGGVLAAAVVTLLFTPHWLEAPSAAGRHGGSWEEIVLFFAFGLLIGLLVDRERLETQRRQDQEHLALLGEAAATVAHELKNPIVTIGAHILKMQRKLLPDDPQWERLNIIFRECQRVELLLKDMVHFARPIGLDLEATDINKLLKRVLEVIGPQAEKNGIQLSSNLDGDLPPVQVDQTRLTQVFYNLALNAIQACPPAGLVLIKTVRKRNQVLVEVSDNGCGVPAEFQQQIFRPFFSTKKEGSGMGLAISRRIVELHQGKLQCRSNEPRGAVFTLVLPIKKN
ncbi:MAG: ATP-binding protein [Desulfobacterota bacterium]|nr:ATP-binding protein [Thermodesulfobacteriota bacterium]